MVWLCRECNRGREELTIGFVAYGRRCPICDAPLDPSNGCAVRSLGPDRMTPALLERIHKAIVAASP